MIKISEADIKKYRPYLQFYVLRHEFNEDKIEFFNVFDNIKVFEYAIKHIKDFKKDRDFEKFKKEMDSTVKWEEWSRVEYEIIVRGMISKKDNEFKIDCYEQFHANLDMFCDYIKLLVENKVL